MKRVEITKRDRELIRAAGEVIRRNYVRGRHHVGAAVRTKSGRVFAGVHLESGAIDVCAEAVTLGMAASNGERKFQAIVAVTLGKGNRARVISPCGVCRELIRYYGPEIEVIHVDGGKVRKRRAIELLPGPYMNSRHRMKERERKVRKAK